MARLRLRMEKGTAMFNVLVLILVVSVMALGASLLVPHEAASIRERVESEQALYLAEAGLEYAKAYLEGKFPDYPGAYSESRALSTGSFTVTITPSPPASPWLLEYNIVSVGTSGESVRGIRALEKLKTFAQYVYFTDQESPPSMDGPIWFASHDWIAGPLHTNDQIHIMGDPVFGDEVTSAWGGPDDHDPGHSPAFMYYNGSSGSHIESADPSNPPYDHPTFSGGYELGAGHIQLPTDLVNLETMALSAGIHTTQTTEVRFARDVSGSPLDGYVSYRLWESGAWGSWTDVEISTLETPVIFVNGTVYVSGVLDGQVTLGSATEIRITDDIVYDDAVDGIPNEGCDDMLGLVSAGDVVVVDNAANGDNVIIDASIMAISGSFKVENHDDGDPRGYLRVYGGIIQKYRGPVGIGWVDDEDLIVHISHGYTKEYHFDSRFVENSPPYFYFTGEYERLAWAEIPTTG